MPWRIGHPRPENQQRQRWLAFEPRSPQADQRPLIAGDAPSLQHLSAVKFIETEIERLGTEGGV